MDTNPEAAYERQQQRERLRRRREESRREDLCYAASQMIPDHGLAITLGTIATLARMSRQVAAALYPSVADLAVDVVCRAWRALIEATAPTPDMTTEDFLARLIQALRADEATHRVWQTIHSGLRSRTHRTMADAEAFLTMCIGQALREIRPDIPADTATEVGDRVLSLARHAAYAASAPDPRAEAALIADLLPRFYTASADVRPGVPPLDPAGDKSPDPVHFTHVTDGGLGPQAPAGPGQSPGLPSPWVQPGKHGRVHPAVKTVSFMRPALALILLVPLAVAACTFSSSSPPPPAANTYVVPSPPPPR